METARTQCLRRAFIVLFLGGQLLAPASYYLWRDNPMDERFAWRMFSPVRMVRCTAYAFEGQEKVNLSNQVHMVWTTLMRRGRLDVVDAVAAQLCETSATGQVSFEVQCILPDGEVWRPRRAGNSLCEGSRGSL